MMRPVIEGAVILAAVSMKMTRVPGRNACNQGERHDRPRPCAQDHVWPLAD